MIGLDQVGADAFRGAAKPFLDIAIQDHIAEHGQEHHRQQAQGQRSRYQFGFDARAFPVSQTL